MSPMNNRLLVPRKVPGLLDLVPGAASAYSLRSLSNSYADPVVTVRRSSDEAEEDFTASEVSDGTLAAFCGAGDGFVKQWWDQSGNARHAVAPADANEPQIVDSGVVITEEGKPAFQFNGSTHLLRNNDLAGVFTGTDVVLHSFSVLKTASTAASNLIAFGFGNNVTLTALRWVGQNGGSARLVENDGVGSTATLSGGSLESQSLLSTQSNMDLAFLYRNGAVEDSSTSTFGAMTLNRFSIGCLTRNTDIAFWDGTIQEVVIYQSDVSSQRELLEAQIAWSYSV